MSVLAQRTEKQTFIYPHSWILVTLSNLLTNGHDPGSTRILQWERLMGARGRRDRDGLSRRWRTLGDILAQSRSLLRCRAGVFLCQYIMKKDAAVTLGVVCAWFRIPWAKCRLILSPSSMLQVAEPPGVTIYIYHGTSIRLYVVEATKHQYYIICSR